MWYDTVYDNISQSVSIHQENLDREKAGTGKKENIDLFFCGCQIKISMENKRRNKVESDLVSAEKERKCKCIKTFVIQIFVDIWEKKKNYGE